MPLDSVGAVLNALPLREHIVALLTNAILEGRIQPGERLNESLLARQWKVSRAPIREALQQLEEQGLVVCQPRRGMFVTHLKTDDRQKINSLRLVLEAEALELARERATPELLADLERRALVMEQAQGANAIETTRLDLDFHRCLWKASGNEYLERTLASLTAPLFACAVLTAPEEAKARMILDSHRPLVEFVAGDGFKSAQRIIYEHIALRWETVERYASSGVRGVAQANTFLCG